MSLYVHALFFAEVALEGVEESCPECSLGTQRLATKKDV